MNTSGEDELESENIVVTTCAVHGREATFIYPTNVDG
jgi:hypothetical protein